MPAPLPHAHGRDGRRSPPVLLRWKSRSTTHASEPDLPKPARKKGRAPPHADTRPVLHRRFFPSHDWNKTGLVDNAGEPPHFSSRLFPLPAPALELPLLPPCPQRHL